MTTLAAYLAGAILAILVGRAVWILRSEARAKDGGRPRGVPPGNGYTEVQSEYTSGVGGGNHMTTRIPTDPQEYARSFVPKRAGKHRS